MESMQLQKLLAYPLELFTGGVGYLILEARKRLSHAAKVHWYVAQSNGIPKS